MRLLLIIIFFSSFSLSNAQEGPEVGGGLGAAHYFGDLNPSFNVGRPGIAIHGVARYNFNTRISVKAGLTFAQISGSDEDSKNNIERERNLNFYSNVFELNGQIEFNFLPYYHGSKYKFFTPYIYLGPTLFNYNPKTEYKGTTYTLRNVRTEGQFDGEEYDTYTLGVLYGFGFKYSLNYRWSLNFDLSGRLLFTDYLDDVSTTYYEFDPDDNPLAYVLSDRSIELTGTKIFQPGQQRGRSTTNDMYATFTISVVYYLGQIKCPKL